MSVISRSTHFTRDDAPTLGMAALTAMVYAGADLAPVWNELVAKVGPDAAGAAALMDLSTLLQMTGQMGQGLELQRQALQLRRVYSRPHGAGDGLRVLALVVAGDPMANTPLDFLLDGSDIDLQMAYVDPEVGVPHELPMHDVAFLAIGESEANRAALAKVAPLLPIWPRRMVNGFPDRIAGMTRDGVHALFADTPEVVSPPVLRIGRAELVAIGDGGSGVTLPVIVRPIGTHAGVGMVKIDDAGQVAAYLEAQPEASFYVSPFVDYSGPDGLFRKQRIAFVEGRPFIGHMAISEHWMVHYLNAGMEQSEAKRAEEAVFMDAFDDDFAVRHKAAFEALHRGFGLDYFAIDCAETKDGRLLLFEADVAMILHAMDRPDLFAYKQPRMRLLFTAFQLMLHRAAAEGGPEA